MFKKRCRRHAQGHACTLRDFPCGSRIRIKDINGCPKDRCRLLALGLTPGTAAEVSANAGGSCCLRVRDADIILGDDLAGTVMASPLSEDEGQVA